MNRAHNRLTADSPDFLAVIKPKTDVDRRVCVLYQPSPRLRAAGTLSPAEIALVEGTSA